ncbi:MAG: YqjK family protein [Steroidobacteraceae bacterium]
MSAGSSQLELRRDLLVLRSRLLRTQVALDGAAIGARVAQVDRGISTLRGVVRSPLVLGVAGFAALAVGPVRAVRWAGRGLVALSLARRVMRLLAQSR